MKKYCFSFVSHLSRIMEKYFKRKTPSSTTSDNVTEQATKKKPNEPIDVIDLNDLPWDSIG